MLKRNIVVPVLVAVSLFTSGSMVVAKETVRGTTMGERVEKRITSRCEVANKQIDARIKNYNSRKDLHIRNYQKMVEKWQALAARLKAKGYDVSKLETDLKTLDEMVKKAATEYAQFIARLEGTRDDECGMSEGTFRAELAAAREELKGFREEIAKIAKFIKETILPDLKALRAQIPTPTPTVSQ